MPTRSATASWSGGLKSGKGTLKVESGAFSGPYEYMSRFEQGPSTNPEELIGAAHAGCFAMFLSSLLEGNKTPAKQIDAKSSVTLTPGEKGPTITKIDLSVVAVVSGITDAKFQEIAKDAKSRCPVSKSLASVATMTLDAKLKSA